ncbi:MAG TPA: Gfo/Idh/MocA family oxidoreductase [Thermoanaerobaculia bacterium]|jgi:glucose-fructose oxidoreductase|nr:Gfo/Idh/MocA family oxidoreductase [Thermoanaerobaculia bacterium]
MPNKTTRARGNGRSREKVRYAVVGLGWFAQTAVLPAFAHARDNSELVALVSGDPSKLRKLGRKYRVEQLYSYDDYPAILGRGGVNAVYIVLPNHLHRDYAVAAADAGVHVVCEKPMAVTEEECQDMIHAAQASNVRLMIAYRLHFDEANLTAAELANSGKIGDPRIFSSVFTMQVEDEDNIRLNPVAMGGGTLYDIGIYCINGARSLFRAEPVEVVAVTANNGERRFRHVDEMTSAVLRFPGERLASFTSSFGASEHDSYRVVGTKGDVFVDDAYEFADPKKLELTVGERKTRRSFPKRDQVAAEIVHFSECVIDAKEPEPSGLEGLADVRIIRALYRSAAEKRAVRLPPFEKPTRPSIRQVARRPPVRRAPETVRAQAPSGH